MYILNKNPLHFKYCVTYKSVLDDKQFLIKPILQKKKKTAFTRMSHFFESAIWNAFLQKLGKAKSYE